MLYFIFFEPSGCDANEPEYELIVPFRMLHLVSGINSLFLSVNPVLISLSLLTFLAPVSSSNVDSPFSSSIAPSLFHSQLKTYLFHKSFQPHSACLESVGGPSGAARGRQPHFRCADDDGRKSLLHRRRSAGGRSDRSTTSRRPQKATQHHVSPSVDHTSALRAVFRIPVTTSGDLILLPVWDRHPKLNVAQCPRTG